MYFIADCTSDEKIIVEDTLDSVAEQCTKKQIIGFLKRSKNLSKDWIYGYRPSTGQYNALDLNTYLNGYGINQLLQSNYPDRHEHLAEAFASAINQSSIRLLTEKGMPVATKTSVDYWTLKGVKYTHIDFAKMLCKMKGLEIRVV